MGLSDRCSFFFESTTWDETNVGFEKVPGGETYANRSVISYHFYIPPLVSPPPKPLPTLDKPLPWTNFLQITHLEFYYRQKDAKRLNCSSAVIVHRNVCMLGSSTFLFIGFLSEFFINDQTTMNYADDYLQVSRTISL